MKYTFEVEGMNCARCETKVEKSLHELPIIRDVSAKADAGSGLVEVFSPNADAGRLKRATKDAEYTPKKPKD